MIDDSLARRILIYAAVTGAVGVASWERWAAHFLPTYLGRFEELEPETFSRRLDQFDVGVRYHLLHSVALLALSSAPFGNPFWRRQVARCFLLGILLFSGSLYLLVFANLPILGAVTPLGGLTWILGWLLLLAVAMRSSRKSKPHE